MEDLLQHIKRIQDKLNILLKQHQSLQKENEKLRQQLRVVSEKDGLQQVRIDELTQQLALLKAAKSGMTDDDKRDFEKRINLYIREIDKCIAALSE